MIEALACGTPIIAYQHGSVLEVMSDSRAGFVVDTIDEAVRATARIASLDRRRCREMFDERFTAERMANDYVTVYQRLIEARAR
jgi:glycosyltransferase involved in cell wall biosynthesis